MISKFFFENIKVIGFDFDDTLVDEQYSAIERWHKVLKEYSFLSPDLAKTFFKVYKQKGASYKFHVDDTLAKLNIDRKFVKKIVSKFLKTNGKESLLPGALDLLGLLKKRGIKIGIITDGKKAWQKGRIAESGVSKFVDFIYYGNGKKENKPSEAITKKLSRLLKVSFPTQFLYIGNELKSDIVGMLLIGARACWVTKEKGVFKNKRAIRVKSLKNLLKYF